MKYLILLFALFSFNALYSQQTIKISYHKNIHLIFNSNIVKDDCSSENILISHNANILKLGAAQAFEEEKSVTVITDNNILFTFIINYNEELTQLNYLIPDSIGILMPNSVFKAKNVFKDENTGTEIDKENLNAICRNVLRQKHLFSDIGTAYKKITVQLVGIWINENFLFFKLIMSNDSNISYDISSTNLYIQDKSFLKKASTAPTEKEPFHIYSDSHSIDANTKDNVYIMIFEKFTISKGKKLIFEVVEKNGGRKLEFEILKDFIIKAPKLN